MKLHSTSNPHLNTVTAYGQGYIEINQQRYEHPIICRPKDPVLAFTKHSVNHIDHHDLEALVSPDTEIVLIGTGHTQQFIHPSMIKNLIAQRIAVECMNSFAAARTYNILMSEERHIVLLYFPT